MNFFDLMPTRYLLPLFLSLAIQARRTYANGYVRYLHILGVMLRP